MTTFFEHQRAAYKRKYLRNLIVLASADGHLDDQERKMVYDIARTRGLKHWQTEALIAEGITGEEIFLPESFGNRMNLLFDVMQIFHADARLDAQEIALLQEIAVRCNLSRCMMDELIALFAEGTPDHHMWREFVGSLLPSHEDQDVTT